MAKSKFVEAETMTIEGVLHDQLVAFMAILLKYNSGKTTHDSKLLAKHIDQRAAESVEEAMALVMGKLELLTGPSQGHRSLQLYLFMRCVLTMGGAE